MKIRVFEAGKGDCLLLTTAAGRNILVDGGLVDTFGNDAYSSNVAPHLGKMSDKGESLDLVCVSHIDQDHIGGILRMLDDHFDWRVFDFQQRQGLDVEPPENPRPPEIAEIWHNSFHELVSKNRRAIGDAVAAAAAESVMLGSDEPAVHGFNFLDDLATSMNEAAQLSRRIGAGQLGIPLNTHFDGKLVRGPTSGGPIEIGDMTLSVVGPTSKQLRDLRKKWNEWLRSDFGKRQISRIRRNTDHDEERLEAGDLNGFLENSVLGPSLGDRNTVTEENVASIVMIAEEAGKQVLLTGDARDDDVIEGLVESGHADADGHIHVEVLKLQHHGSKNNISLDFVKKVTADHYILSGNGNHHNPHFDALDMLINSRIGKPAQRSTNAQTANKFKLWFSADEHSDGANKEHMQEVEKRIKARAGASGGQMAFRFNRRKSFEFTV